MNSITGRGAGRRRDVEPEDARRGFITVPACGLEEATADREMADAERAVVSGTATHEQRSRVRTVGGARTHEDRRTQWMGSAPGRAAGDPTDPSQDPAAT